MVRSSVLFKIFVGFAFLASSIQLQSTGVLDKVEREIMCLAVNIYYEARGESQRGRIAVGNVTMNRARNKNFPNSVCEVVTQKHKNTCQFSWFCMKKLPDIREELFADIRELARRIYTGEIKDITKGSTHFHSIDVNPPWIENKVVTVEIGNHIFYRK